METIINQKEYLKKYLGIGKAGGDKKKKKKKPKIISNGLKIIDDQIEVKLDEEIKEDLNAENEDAPQVVAVIDDRPPSLRIDEETRNKLWKPIGEVDDDSETKTAIKFEGGFKLKKLPKTKLDRSPPRRKARDDRSFSKVEVKTEKVDEENCDNSRLSVRIKEEDITPPRRSQSQDNSPPRKKSTLEVDISPPRRSGNESSRKNDDISPPRKHRTKSSPDRSPPRRIKRDADISPPRRNRDTRSPPRKNRQKDRDISPPRRNRTSPSRQKHRDISPPRRNRRNSRSPQRRIKEEPLSPKRKKSRWNVEEESSSSERMTKTLDGKTAGLQNASDLAQETAEMRRRDNEMFKTMSSEVSGANAATVVRSKPKETDPVEEEARQKRERENKEKYDRWGKGLKQVEAQSEKIAQDLHEMNKPLARYADDEDLERYLKNQEREGDPMLAYIRKKKKKVAIESGKPMKPQYEGEYMPNRFGIAPGYRWDGVDRSNGYEKKYFEIQNTRKADIEESYKWSTEDM